MFSVALIGPDGSGKTTIARRLEASFPGRFKYLYMGINAESSNVTLPTTRIAEWIKHLLDNGQAGKPRHQASQATARSRGRVWSTLRILNRFAEEIFRYALSWIYKKQRRIVVFDRFFKFDFACDPVELSRMPMSERLHRIWLSKLYPYPDLIIFLDAPPEVLFARKPETTLQFLSERQRAILMAGKALSNIVRVDAARPLEDVYSEVEHCVMNFRGSPHRNSYPPE